VIQDVQLSKATEQDLQGYVQGKHTLLKLSVEEGQIYWQYPLPKNE
jgi:hypothetical protein